MHDDTIDEQVGLNVVEHVKPDAALWRSTSVSAVWRTMRPGRPTASLAVVLPLLQVARLFTDGTAAATDAARTTREKKVFVNIARS